MFPWETRLLKSERSSANTWINKVQFLLSLVCLLLMSEPEKVWPTSSQPLENKKGPLSPRGKNSRWHNNGVTQTDRWTPSLAPSPLPLPCMIPQVLFPQETALKSVRHKPGLTVPRGQRVPAERLGGSGAGSSSAPQEKQSTAQAPSLLCVPHQQLRGEEMH